MYIKRRNISVCTRTTGHLSFVRGFRRDEIFYKLCSSRRSDAIVTMTAEHGRFIFKNTEATATKRRMHVDGCDVDT